MLRILVSCTNTHHDITDLLNYGMVKNTKTWISWEWHKTFLWNKKILNLCLRWHIFRSYCFVAEVTFNNISVQHSTVQKHLGLYLDEKLNFNIHIAGKTGKANKGIEVIKKLFKNLPRNALLNIYKSFVRPHIDYGDIAYDWCDNE